MSAVSQKGPVGIADVRSDQPGGPTDAVPRRWHISVFGGLTRTGRWSAGARHVVVTALGNVELDLSQADVEKGLAITVVAILGGAGITVPGNVSVETDGFTFLGSERIDVPEPAEVHGVLHLRTFSFLSSIRARRGTLSPRSLDADE